MQIARVSGNPLYDTHRLSGAAIAAQTLRFFVNPVGSSADGFTPKTLAETGSLSQGLSNGTAFVINAFGVYIRKADADKPIAVDDAVETYQDISDIMRNSVVQFEQGSDLQTYGPAEFYSGGAGISGANVGFDNGGAAVGIASVANGSTDRRSLYKLPEPIRLEDGTSFAWNLRVTRDVALQQAAAKYDVSILLWGVQVQRIQP